MNDALEQRRASLVEVLDRTLQTGIAVRGDIMISVAGVDLVGLDLRVILAAAGRLAPPADQQHPETMRAADDGAG